VLAIEAMHRETGPLVSGAPAYPWFSPGSPVAGQVQEGGLLIVPTPAGTNRDPVADRAARPEREAPYALADHSRVV
jgi:hypothetical protein